MNKLSIDTSPKRDRRIQRTRGLLQTALRDLIIEQGYDSLTIQDITDRANLRRATFYMHYKDKEELLLSALSETFGQLVRVTEPLAAADGLGGKTQVEAYLVTFAHVAENHALYKNLLMSSSGAMFTHQITTFLAGLILTGLKPQAHVAIAPEVIANYIAGAEIAMITWWLAHDMPYSPEAMAQAIHRLTLEGVQTVLKEGENQ
jgi:AcrR family transcriptional regulator